VAETTITLYTETTTADLTVTEAELEADVAGYLEVSSRRFVDGEVKGEIETLHVFYPHKFVASLSTAKKVVDANADEYEVKYLEEYDSHQEIYMRKVGG